MTDQVVRQEIRLTPLSVSADRIGHVALRCASLLALFAQQGHEVSRDGSGKVVEVYPAASLKIWGLPWRGYKRPGDTQALSKLVDRPRGQGHGVDMAGEQRTAFNLKRQRSEWR